MNLAVNINHKTFPFTERSTWEGQSILGSWDALTRTANIIKHIHVHACDTSMETLCAFRFHHLVHQMSIKGATHMCFVDRQIFMYLRSTYELRNGSVMWHIEHQGFFHGGGEGGRGHLPPLDMLSTRKSIHLMTQ